MQQDTYSRINLEKLKVVTQGLAEIPVLFLNRILDKVFNKYTDIDMDHPRGILPLSCKFYGTASPRY